MRSVLLCLNFMAKVSKFISLYSKACIWSKQYMLTGENLGMDTWRMNVWSFFFSGDNTQNRNTNDAGTRSATHSPQSFGSSGADSGVESTSDGTRDLPSIAISLCGGLTDNKEITKGTDWPAIQACALDQVWTSFIKGAVPSCGCM